MDTKLEARPKKKRGRPLGSKSKATAKTHRGLRTTTLQSNTDFGKLARMQAGDTEIFVAPDGVSKQMRRHGAYFERLGGSRLFSQTAIYGLIPGRPEVVELVMVKRIAEEKP